MKLKLLSYKKINSITKTFKNNYYEKMYNT
jgi:hypothetical protein